LQTQTKYLELFGLEVSDRWLLFDSTVHYRINDALIKNKKLFEAENEFLGKTEKTQ